MLDATTSDSDRNGQPFADCLREGAASASDGIRSLEQLAPLFGFELDAFQEDALSAVLGNRSVVVSVPTGSGKTVVGEAVLHLALSRGMRAFYTTPLKALSNQKYGDFCERFGLRHVGLLTGDVSINSRAPLLVMTTEVYRNMLYRTRLGKAVGDAGGEGGDGDAIELTDDVFAVVLDEFHYMNDVERGTVWEESVIGSSPQTLLVALSATMRNARDICTWMNAVHGPTELVASDFRPVPLQFVYANRDGLYPLLVREEQRPDAKPHRGFMPTRSRAARKEAQARSTWVHDGWMLNPALRRPARHLEFLRRPRPSESLAGASHAELAADLLRRQRQRQVRSELREEVPTYPFLVRRLHRHHKLPAIVFIFSRSGCDQAMRDVLASNTELELLTPSERAELQTRLDAFLAEHPEMLQTADAQTRCLAMLQGVASHHAGMLPMWKMLTERLFQANLIKCVFATETLAAGINMPARSTVITALSKRAGASGIVNLTPNALLQMAGRAGRRGMDRVGFAIIVQSPWEPSAPLAYKLLAGGPDALQSNFAPTYSMVLNLLRHPGIGLVNARRYVERSFGSFMAMQRRSRGKRNGDDDDSNNSLPALEARLEEARQLLEQYGGVEQVRAYEKLRDRVRNERRILRSLRANHDRIHRETMEDVLLFCPAGMQVQLRRTGERAVFVGVVSDAGPWCREGLPRYALLTRDGRLCVCDAQYVASVLSDEGLVLEGMSDDVWRTDAVALRRLSWRRVSHVRSRYGEASVSQESVVDPSTVAWFVQHLAAAADDEDDDGGGALVEVPEADDNEEDEEDEDEERVTMAPVRAEYPLYEAEPPEVRAQRERVEELRARLAQFAVHAAPNKAVVLYARKSLSQLEAQVNRLRGEQLRTEMQASAGASWRAFLGLVQVLLRFECLQPLHEHDAVALADSLRSDASDVRFAVTDFGRLVAELRAENEVWLAVAIAGCADRLARLAPHQLAATMAALAVDVAPPSSVQCAYVPSAAVVHMCQDVLEPLRQMVDEAQMEAVVQFSEPESLAEAPEVNFPSLTLSTELVGLVEEWARGASWPQLLKGTTLDEGDVVRLLRRGLDTLRQLPMLALTARVLEDGTRAPSPLVPESLRRNARRAIALMDRYPVTDAFTYRVSSVEREEGVVDHSDGADADSDGGTVPA